MFAHDFMSQEEMEEYLNTTHLEKLVLLDPCISCNCEDMPKHIEMFYKSQYLHELAHSDAILTWNEFLALGDAYTGEVEAPVDIDRPLFRCYTSGSTGPSKQVVHSAHSIIGTLAQMNFYGANDVRPTWLVTLLPPCLVAVVVSMLLLPLASNKLLILDPFVAPEDIDLELMRYRPNCWPSLPFFCDIMVNSTRIPADFDMSFLASIGAGCEAINNAQLRRVQTFLRQHNCKAVFTTGYGSSEAGSNVGFHISGHPMGNGNVGCPMPLSTVSIFKPGTTQELGYNEEGEICVCAPGNMIGYDNPEATAKALKVHEDGQVWLHMGDIGCMTEDGVIFTRGRGSNKRFTGGFLDLLPMENALADANIDGILDEFFVNIPDPDHEGYFLPFLYVVLNDGYSVDDVRKQVHAHLKPEWIPTEIHAIDARPFWHFKTNRIGLLNEVLSERVSA